MSLPEVQLLRPAWLLALIPLALGLWRLWRSNAGTVAWRNLVDAHLLPHLLVGEDGRAHWLPLTLVALGGLVAVLALAGPVWQKLPQPAYQQQAARVIVVDISRSMNATDLPPSRLAHARFEILDLLRRFREGQTALVAYGTEPYVVSPLTSDAKTIAAQVPSLSTDLLPVHGPKRTDLALEKAGRLLRQGGSAQGQVILLTDALEQPAAALDAARQLRARGYRLSVLGVGSPAGAPVPLPDGGFLQDGDGAVLMPKLDSEVLQSLAAAGGGRYHTASLDDRDIEALVREAPRGRTRAAAKPVTADQWREEGPWLLLALLPLAAVAFRRGWLSPLLLLILIAPAPPADAYSWSGLWLRPDQQAARLLEQGQAQDAARSFQRRDWRAAAAYEAGDYQRALETLETIQDPEAWYNRGNTLARLGDYAKAIAAYDRALAQAPDNADARHNRELVRRLLEQQRHQASQTQPSGRRDDANGGEGSPEPQDAAQAGHESDQPKQGGKSDAQSDGQAPSSARSETRSGRTKEPREQGEHGNPSQATQQANSEAATAQPAPSHSGGAGAGGLEEDQEENKTTASAQEEEENARTGSPGRRERAARAVEQPRATAGGNAEPIAHDDRAAHAGAEPGAADLLRNSEHRESQSRPVGASSDLSMTEAQQAMEHQLNRVPDDPAGLLRQRFLLQHMRRNGQL
jgi:Ca-activated chloride channel family protein